MTDDHFRRLERMYLAAPCNETYKPEITIGKGEAKVSFEILPHFFHSGRAAHGSVYFKALDDAAFFAVNSLVEDVFVLTVSFSVHLIRPISKGRMVAFGTVQNAGRSLWIAESKLEDERGRALGYGSGSFMRSHNRLVDAMGYGGVD